MALLVLGNRMRALRRDLDAANRDLAAERAASSARAEALERERDAAATREQSVWPLLLRRIERQWGESVGAGRDERGVAGTGPADQFAEAVRRELERLREEVGVDATVTGAAADLDGAPARLLALGEAAAALALHAETVTVELGDPVVLVATGWEGDEAAGADLASLGTVQTTGRELRLTLG